MKKLMLLLILSTFTAFADWLDDVVELVENEKCLNAQKASGIIYRYINKDKERIKEIEDHDQAGAKKGLLTKVKDAVVDNAHMVAARTSLKYHQGVAAYLDKLSVNKEKRDAFVKECQKFSKLTCKLAKLEIKYSRTESKRDKARVIAQMGVVKARVEAKRTYLKAVKF